MMSYLPLLVSSKTIFAQIQQLYNYSMNFLHIFITENEREKEKPLFNINSTLLRCTLYLLTKILFQILPKIQNIRIFTLIKNYFRICTNTCWTSPSLSILIILISQSAATKHGSKVTSTESENALTCKDGGRSNTATEESLATKCINTATAPTETYPRQTDVETL